MSAQANSGIGQIEYLFYLLEEEEIINHSEWIPVEPLEAAKHTFGNLRPGHEYQFTVVARDDTGQTALSKPYVIRSTRFVVIDADPSLAKSFPYRKPGDEATPLLQNDPDDVLAIIYAVGMLRQQYTDEEITRMLIITTCFGNDPVSTSQYWAEWALDGLGLEDTKVYEGSDKPLRDSVRASQAGLELPRLVSDNPGSLIDIIALGPLTNIAKAMEPDATWTADVNRLYVVGGAVRASGNVIGPESWPTISEWNIYRDPEAAERVFANWQGGTQKGEDPSLFVIPLDVTRDRDAAIRGRDGEDLDELLAFPSVDAVDSGHQTESDNGALRQALVDWTALGCANGSVDMFDRIPEGCQGFLEEVLSNGISGKEILSLGAAGCCKTDAFHPWDTIGMGIAFLGDSGAILEPESPVLDADYQTTSITVGTLPVIRGWTSELDLWGSRPPVSLCTGFEGDQFKTNFKEMTAASSTSLELEKTLAHLTLAAPRWDEKPHWVDSGARMSMEAVSLPGGSEYRFVELTGEGASRDWKSDRFFVDTQAPRGVSLCYRAEVRAILHREASSQPTTKECIAIDSGKRNGDDEQLIETAPVLNSIRWRLRECEPSGARVETWWSAQDDETSAEELEYRFELEQEGRGVFWEHEDWEPDLTEQPFGILKDGDYILHVYVRDGAGNESEDFVDFWVECGAVAYGQDEEDRIAPTPNPMTWAQGPAVQGDSITLVATQAQDESGYVEYYFEERMGNGNNSGWQESTVYVDDGIPPNTRCCYRVKARDEDGNETDWSNKVCVETAPEGLQPPEGIWASRGEQNGVEITWDPVPSVDGYAVFRSQDTIGVILDKSPISGVLTRTEYIDASGNPGQEYSYAVKSTAGGEWSDLSEIVSGWYVLGPPDSPYGLSASFGNNRAGSDSYLHWGYDGNRDNVDHFEVAVYDTRWVSGRSCMRIVDRREIHESRWQMSCYGFIPGQVRKYKVRAVLRDGSASDWSAVLTVRIP